MTTTNTEKPARVVVGVDGSPQSQQALRWAAGISAMSGAHLEVVTAWEIPATTGWAAWPQGWDPARDAEKALDGTVDSVFGAHRPKDLRLVVREGGAARVLLDESKGALMVVVGSRGHGGFAGMLLGSVSANVAEHAACPVLVVHGESIPAAMAALRAPTDGGPAPTV